MKWIKTYTHRFSLSFAVLFASLFMSFFCFSSDSYATSWTSDNLASYVQSLTSIGESINVNFSSINYPSELYNNTRFFSAFYKGTNYSGYSSFRPFINFSNMDTIMFPTVSTGVYNSSDGFTFYSCFSSPFISLQSGNDYLSFWDFGRLRNNITDLYFTFSDECPSGGSSPSGSLSITENGTYDVTDYAEAVVDVPSSGGGDYSDDLQEIKSAIIYVPAVLLVIYFFYAIYKMIMGGVRR